MINIHRCLVLTRNEIIVEKRKFFFSWFDCGFEYCGIFSSRFFRRKSDPDCLRLVWFGLVYQPLSLTFNAELCRFDKQHIGRDRAVL